MKSQIESGAIALSLGILGAVIFAAYKKNNPVTKDILAAKDGKYVLQNPTTDWTSALPNMPWQSPAPTNYVQIAGGSQ